MPQALRRDEGAFITHRLLCIPLDEDHGMKTYDHIIIGSGTAAQVASARTRSAGWNVAVIDHRPFGGTRALRGCDPKKMLISGAEAIDAVRRMRGHGVAGEPRIEWRELMAFKRSFTDPVPRHREEDFARRHVIALLCALLRRKQWP
jgi:glutathione reductase (NADPH)